MAKKSRNFRLDEVYIAALDELARERGVASRTRMLEYCIIARYMQTHTDRDWDKLLRKGLNTPESSKSGQDVS